MLTELDSTTRFLLGILFLLIGIWIVTALTIKLNRFSRELEHINMEIRRTIGAERAYWKKQKRRLWLTLLPFYRK